MKFLVYSCVFHNEDYVNLFNLLIESYKLYGCPNENTDYLVICSPAFESDIARIVSGFNLDVKIWCLDLKTIFEAAYSRLYIFNYPHINNYNRILYLDTDILITDNINNILELDIDNKLYAQKSGNTNHPFFGSQFFKNNPNVDAFCTGVLFFNNNEKIINLFKITLDHIKTYISSGGKQPECLEQPFIVYNSVKMDIYDNILITDKISSNPTKPINCVICHFHGGPGHYRSKIKKMEHYKKMLSKKKY